MKIIKGILLANHQRRHARNSGIWTPGILDIDEWIEFTLPVFNTWESLYIVTFKQKKNLTGH